MAKETTSDKCRSIIISIRYLGAFHTHQCNRPAKGRLKNGQPACGVHLRVEMEQVKSKEKRREEVECNDLYKKTVQHWADTVGLEISGISNARIRTVTVHFDTLKTWHEEELDNEDDYFGCKD